MNPSRFTTSVASWLVFWPRPELYFMLWHFYNCVTFNLLVTDTKQIYTCYTDTNFNFKLYIIIFSYFHPSCQLSFDLYDWSYGGDTLQLIPCRCPTQVGGEVFWVLILFLDVSEITKTRSYFNRENSPGKKILLKNFQPKLTADWIFVLKYMFAST